MKKTYETLKESVYKITSQYKLYTEVKYLVANTPEFADISKLLNEIIEMRSNSNLYF